MKNTCPFYIVFQDFKIRIIKICKNLLCVMKVFCFSVLHYKTFISHKNLRSPMQGLCTKIPYPPVPNNRGLLIKGGGSPADNLNINKWGVQLKGRVWKMFPIKSGNPVSLILGVPNKTCLHHLDIFDTGATITLNKIRKANLII